MALQTHPQNIIQIGHNFSEKIDETTVKILCVTCGGKGYYLLMNYWTDKGEIVNCEECEKGFRYGKKS